MVSFVDESVQLAEDYKSQLTEMERSSESESISREEVTERIFAIALYDYTRRDEAELGLKEWNHKIVFSFNIHRRVFLVLKYPF